MTDLQALAMPVLVIFALVLIVMWRRNRPPEWPERDAAWAIVDRDAERPDFV